MKYLSFDGMVELYDETRVFNKNCFNAALDFLIEKFPPQIFSKVFEPGIGTGRIAIPLADRGYQITGVDISEEMLTLLKIRLAQAKEPLRISYQKADVTKLPFPDAAFDMAIAVHLFYFIQEWRKAADELLRVVRRGGPVVLMHTGTGAEIPFLNERYKELSAEEGFSIKEIGYMKSRAYSFTTTAPDDTHLMIMGRLESEMHHRFDSLTTAVEVPNQIYLVLILRK